MQMKRIEASGLFDFFNEILIAGEEVYSKPDPQAFYLVSKRLDLEPAECIFIGDSPESDIPVLSFLPAEMMSKYLPFWLCRAFIPQSDLAFKLCNHRSLHDSCGK